MSNDLNIIKELENEIKFALVKQDDVKWDDNAYQLDQNGNVIALALFHLNLKSIPKTIYQLTNLTRLYLCSNQIKLPFTEILSKKNEVLIKLKELDLSGNGLEFLPTEICALKSLIKLRLCLNKLEAIPEGFEKLKNLKQIDLHKNQLSSLPEAIGEMDNLAEINLSQNQLLFLPASIGKLKNIDKLELSFNHLIEIPSEIGNLKKLTFLNLAYNQLVKLPSEIGGLKNLITLDLQSNDLACIPNGFGELKSIVTLNLSKNNLMKIPSEVSVLENLTRINLSFNKLKGVPLEFSKMKQLKELHLDDNPLQAMPTEISTRGIHAVRSYLGSLKEGKKRFINEARVILVGDGGAGKTSLVKRFLDEGFSDSQERTQGINIKEKNIEVKDKKNGVEPFIKNIKINFWDFGGQQIMHATHQFFLAKRCLYLLVLDGRKEDAVEDWLKLIMSFGGNSPILIVMNKIDQSPSYDLNRKSLKNKFNTIKGFYRISCKNEFGIAKLLKEVTFFLQDVEHFRTEWSEKWFMVKESLEALKKDRSKKFINKAEYRSLCQKFQITKELDQQTLIHFLHDLGVVLHFKDFDLSDMHVLESEWITEAVYRILNSIQLSIGHGVLKLNQLDQILRQKSSEDYFYPSERYPFIIKLMQKFELCYSNSEESILIPDLLDIQEPEFKFDESDSLQFIFDYDFLPKSIMPRFIVKMHKDIKDYSGTKLQWRSGVLLKNERFNSEAIVKTYPNEKRISISVIGQAKKGLLFCDKESFLGTKR